MPPKKGQKNPNMARLGKDNPKWKNGKSSDYRRRIMKAKPGELIHHIDKVKSHNTKSNFKKLKPTKTKTAIGVHNASHSEKGKK